MKRFFALIAACCILMVSCSKTENQTQPPASVKFPVPGGPPLYSVSVYNGNLIASGVTTVGTVNNSIGQWNGSSWSPLGKGISGIVYSMVLYNGNLIVGGAFDSAGGIKANNIAQWNGSTWDTLGAGIGGIKGSNACLYALDVYNGNLIVGGYFDSVGRIKANKIAQWNGSNWAALGLGIDAVVGDARALLVYNGDLVVGGDFDSAGGVNANNIAQWNGSIWSALGSGVNSPNSLTVYNGNLIDGSQQWNGIAWSSIGFSNSVSNIVTYNSNLYAVSGGFEIYEWNGSSWVFLTSESGFPYWTAFISSFTVYNGNLVAVGLLNEKYNIKVYNGSTWSQL